MNDQNGDVGAWRAVNQYCDTASPFNAVTFPESFPEIGAASWLGAPTSTTACTGAAWFDGFDCAGGTRAASYTHRPVLQSGALQAC